MNPKELNLDYIWQFKFEDYSDAEAARNSLNRYFFDQPSGAGFDSSQWLDKQKSMLGLAANGVLPRSASVFELLDNSSVENIIDFGGGPGWVWAYIVNSNLHKDMKYYNIELESSRLAFEYLSKELPKMKFTTIEKISKLIHDKNIVYCNSVLQYFENNSTFLSLIQASNPVSIILDDIAGSNEEFYSLQNYYGYLQINRFLNLDKLISDVCSQGYRLSVTKPYHKEFSKGMISKIWLGDDKDVDSEIPSSISLLFQRN